MNDDHTFDPGIAVEIGEIPDLAPLPKIHKPGIVAITADEAGRYTRFAISMQGLAIPHDSRSLWQVGNDISGNRNSACEQLLRDDAGSWIWFIDDDHAFEPAILLRLLERDVDIVTPLCLRRVQPFLPVPCVDDDFMDITRYRPDELVEVQHAGSSGMLIRREVLEAIEPPWFELGYDDDGRRVSEDVTFCRKATAAGFAIHVDIAVLLGHITTAVVWPRFDEDEGRWLTQFEVADGAKLWINPAVPEPVEEQVA